MGVVNEEVAPTTIYALVPIETSMRKGTNEGAATSIAATGRLVGTSFIANGAEESQTVLHRRQIASLARGPPERSISWDRRVAPAHRLRSQYPM